MSPGAPPIIARVAPPGSGAGLGWPLEGCDRAVRFAGRPFPVYQLLTAAQAPFRQATPSTPRRARLTAAASKLKSAATLTSPRTRARRPPWRRRMRWLILRSTLGRVAR